MLLENSLELFFISSGTLCLLISTAAILLANAGAATPPTMAAVFLLTLATFLGVFFTFWGSVTPLSFALRFALKLENTLTG